MDAAIGKFGVTLPGGHRTRVLRTWHVQGEPKRLRAIRRALGGVEQEGGLTLPADTPVSIVIESVAFRHDRRYAEMRFHLERVPTAGSFELWSSSESVMNATPGPAVLGLERVAFVDCDGEPGEYRVVKVGSMT